MTRMHVEGAVGDISARNIQAEVGRKLPGHAGTDPKFTKIAHVVVKLACARIRAMAMGGSEVTIKLVGTAQKFASGIDRQARG